jgi:glycosyltransferase involved in cell wall biosynthesis
VVSLDKAREIAQSGHKVHVLVKSSDGNTVDFEHGIWVHRIASQEVEKTDKAIELEIPDAAWSHSKVFLDELDRISLHRSVDIVHAASTCLSGAVRPLSDKYCLVTSLSPDDVAAIKPAESAGTKESATHDNLLAVSRQFILKQSQGVFVPCAINDQVLPDLNDYIDTRETVISCANSAEEIIQDYVKILDNKKRFVRLKLSIIIPVYNSEKYLHACLRPVLDQVDEGVEIIAIDDASEDNSLDILNYYRQRNANIKVLRNETNLGPGPARNYGLSQASGEYIAFLDSDDSVNESYFKEMLNSAEVHQSDIVFSNVDPEIPVFDDFSKIYAPFSQNLDNLPAECKMTGIIGKLYRREFLQESNIHFLDKKIIIGEDIPFNWISYFCAKKISFAPGAVYRYRMHGSGCDSVNDERILGIFDALEYVKSIYEEKDTDGEREAMIVHIIVSHVAQNYVKLMTASEPDSALIQRYKQRAKTLMTFPVELVLNNAFIEQYAKDFYIELDEEYKT